MVHYSYKCHQNDVRKCNKNNKTNILRGRINIDPKRCIKMARIAATNPFPYLSRENQGNDSFNFFHICNFQ